MRDRPIDHCNFPAHESIKAKMKLRRLLQQMLPLAMLTSCGILGIYKDDTNPDPVYQQEKLREISTRPAAVKHDSLIRKIDEATITIPADLAQTTLIIETYKYGDFLELYENKFVVPKDSKRSRKDFARYEKIKRSLIKDPKFDMIYMDKGDYETLDLKKYKYVLKTTNRVAYDPDHLVITNDGFVYPLVSTLIYYIYNRQTHEVLRDVKDLSSFSKQK